MGTTIVAAAVRGGVAQILSVGDSRAYRITRRGIVQITKDHSLVEDMVDRGELTRAQARNHPKKNFITRALGVDAQVRADGFTVRLRPGERAPHDAGRAQAGRTGTSSSRNAPAAGNRRRGRDAVVSSPRERR